MAINSTTNKYLFITILTLLLQSCSSIYHSNYLEKQIDCSKIDQELDLRHSLFRELQMDEIKKRQQIKVPTISNFNNISVVTKIVEAIKNAPPNAKLIPVDLRHYDNVLLGNIIITNASNDISLNLSLLTSKYSQGFFALINFSPKNITILPPSTSNIFKKTIINRGDLNNVEIVINVSDSHSISGNMKFSPKQKISIIANRIANPYQLDLRESSNMQFNLNQKWIMSVYSIENSHLDGGKDTTGLFKFINNQNTKKITLHKFYNSLALCYKDSSGVKFKPKSVIKS